MGDRTKIEWCDASWNFATGCLPVSAGCAHCYASTFAARWSKPGERWEGLTDGEKWTGKIKVYQKKLVEPLRWKKPRDVFPCSMSDLGYEAIPDDLVAAAFGVIAAAHNHRFYVLTKRPELLAARVAAFGPNPVDHCFRAAERYGLMIGTMAATVPWPLQNMLVGVTVEDRIVAAKRLDVLSQIPAAGYFASLEPLIADVDLEKWLELLDWVIVGGESGRRARPMAVAWAAKVVDQCLATSVPVFVKQLGTDWSKRTGYRDDNKGARSDRWPAEVCLKQRPIVGRRINA